MLATCYLLGIDSATPPIDNMLNTDQDTLDQSVIDNRNSRYGAICTVSQGRGGEGSCASWKVGEKGFGVTEYRV